MTDKTISALTGASTPLAGTEVLPIVQSGSTVKVAVSDLTAGRAVSATGLTTGSATSLGLGTNGSISQMTLNTGGIVGLNVTPSTWLSTKTAIQMPDGSYYATTGGTMFVGANVYTNAASASTYVSNGYATRYRQTNGEHQFWTAVSGTAETTIPFIQVLNLNASGIVTMPAYGVGTATFSAAGVISSVSDENWKRKDGVPSNPTEMLGKLQPGYWYYNDEKKATFGTDRQLGFYAQNVNAAIGPEAAPVPESMTLTDAEGLETFQQKPWGYYDRSVLAVVVMALQEALATVKALELRVQVLEQKG